MDIKTIILIAGGAGVAYFLWRWMSSATSGATPIQQQYMPEKRAELPSDLGKFAKASSIQLKNDATVGTLGIMRR